MNRTLPPLEFKRGSDVDPETLIDFWRNNDITLSPTDTPEEVGRAAAINSTLFLVACSEKEIVGTVWGTFDGRRGYVVHLAVRRKDRGRGIGSLLMEEVEERFRAIGCQKVHLFVEEHNREVAKIYHQLGWKERNDLTLFSKSLE